MTTLPPQPTSFVGRERELTAIAKLLADPTCRLLTLLGPGGVGKTRLALEAAAAHGPTFRDGAVFVALQGVQDVTEWISALAKALEVSFHGPEEPEAQLVDRLRERALLLVVDNLEHLLVEPAGSRITLLLSNLLAAATGIKIIVTSRAALRMQEEWILPLTGLSSVPDAHGVEGEALTLFIQRARQANASFSWRQEHADLQRLCELVEGNPLALELAASWTRALPCRAIADEIARDLGFLVSQQRNVAARHASMHALFDHSWTLLDEEARRVLRRMSIFQGGSTHAAAVHIAQAHPQQLAALVDRSLLRHTHDGRYQMHELLRQYVIERWDDAPEDGRRTACRHSRYYLELLADRLPAMQGALQEEACSAVDQEMRNISAAWRHAVETDAVELLLKAADGLEYFCDCRSRYHAGSGLFEVAAHRFESPKPTTPDSEDCAEAQHPLLLSRMQVGMGMCLIRLGRAIECETILRQAIVRLRALRPRPRRQLAQALYWFGHALFWQGRYDEAEEADLESYALYRQGDDTWGIGAAAFALASLYTYQGALDQADRYLSTSAEQLRKLGELGVFSFVILTRGMIARQRGDLPRAELLLLEALEIHGQLYNRWNIGYSTRELGYLALDQGACAEAESYFKESLAAFESIGAAANTIFPLDGLGTVACRRGDYAQAKAHYQRALAIGDKLCERRGQAMCYFSLGSLAARTAELDLAEKYLQMSSKLYAEAGHRIGRGYAESRLAAVIGQDRRRLQEAATRLTHAFDISTELGVTPLALDALLGTALLLKLEQPPSERSQLARRLLMLIAAHRASTHEVKSDAARILGETDDCAMAGDPLQLRDAIAVARRQLDAWRSDPAPDQDVVRLERFEPLTSREVEVLTLLEQGLSNREIAEQLVLTVGTVKWYTSQIYGKLGVQNRSEAAHVARQVGSLT